MAKLFVVYLFHQVKNDLKILQMLYCFFFCFFCFFFYIYNLHFFKQKTYSHQVLIYLNVPGIPVRKPLQNRQIVEEQLDV